MLIDWSVRNCLSCICYLFWTFVRFIFFYLKKKQLQSESEQSWPISLFGFGSVCGRMQAFICWTHELNWIIFLYFVTFFHSKKKNKRKQISDKPNEPRRFHNDRLNLKWAEMHKIFLDQYENNKKKIQNNNGMHISVEHFTLLHFIVSWWYFLPICIESVLFDFRFWICLSLIPKNVALMLLLLRYDNFVFGWNNFYMPFLSYSTQHFLFCVLFLMQSKKKVITKENKK